LSQLEHGRGDVKFAHRLVVHIDILINEESLNSLDEFDGNNERDRDNVLEENKCSSVEAIQSQ